MAITLQLGGPLGSFLDPATQQQIGVNVFGSCVLDVAPDVDAATVDAHRNRIFGVLRNVIGEKLARNQIALPTLAASMPHLIPEIVAACAAQSLGLGNLILNAVVDAPAAPPMPQPQALPPNPYQATANAFERRAKEQLDPRNYEVHGRVNVGGFKVNMSSDGGIDTQGLKNQLKDKVKTEIIWYGIGCVIVGIVLLGLAGLAWYIYAQVKSDAGGAPKSAKTATWDGKSAFTCGANDSVKLEGITAKIATGEAIQAAGNCHLELVNVQITAPTGIAALGGASVTMKGGSIDSTVAAVSAIGAAQVQLQGTKVKGKLSALGGAKITGP